jgi:hypothetical protein
MRVQALSAHVAALAASKAVVPKGVARGEKALGSMVHAQRGGDCVLGVHRALDRLSAETEGGGEGCQGVEYSAQNIPIYRNNGTIIHRCTGIIGNVSYRMHSPTYDDCYTADSVRALLS